MQAALFNTGIGDTSQNHTKRADSLDVKAKIAKLEERRGDCRTLEEYQALTEEINRLWRGWYDMLEDQGQLSLID